MAGGVDLVDIGRHGTCSVTSNPGGNMLRSAAVNPPRSAIRTAVREIRGLVGMIREDTHPLSALAASAMLTIMLVCNYVFDLERGWLDAHYNQYRQIGPYLLVYGGPYTLTLLLDLHLRGRLGCVCHRRVIQAISFGLLVFSVCMFFPWHRPLSAWLFAPELREWGSRVLWNSSRFVCLAVPLFIYWRCCARDLDSFYGLARPRASLRTYYLVIALLVPLAGAASFLPDFQAMYPSYRAGSAESSGYSPWLTHGIFQLVYGLDYATIELFFRGFLVVGLARWLGPSAVLAATTWYCVAHFGKPFGEAVASIIGGHALGVLAYRTGHIWGGIIVHMGLAWTMELFGALQR